MSWLLIAIVAYFFLALVNIGDKLFLGNFVPNYKVYTAIVGFLGLIVFLVSPWFLVWPGGFVFIISLISGSLFLVALLAFFYSLQAGEPSRVIPFIGGLVPIFSLVFAFVFLGSTFTITQVYAFILLIFGSTLIVRLPHRTHWWNKIWESIHPPHHTKEMVVVVSAAVLFAISFVSSKYVFQQVGFTNGFIWMRFGGLIVALWLIAYKDTRQSLINTLGRIKSKKGILFIANQGLGAIGFFLQSLAVSLGSVAIVNALQGVQYVFVIFLAVLVSLKFPKLSGEEKIDFKIIIEKVIAVLIVGAGLVVLAFN